MAERVYIETTVVSYLTARPNRDVVIAGHQEVTRDWWDDERGKYELWVSRLVVTEAVGGDPQAAKERLEAIKAIPRLTLLPVALELAKELVSKGALPKKAANDALHIAIAASHGVPYLLIWNCRHLANAKMRPMIEAVCAARGLKAPITCTPEELMEDAPLPIQSLTKCDEFATPTPPSSTTTWTRFFRTCKNRRRKPRKQLRPPASVVESTLPVGGEDEVGRTDSSALRAKALGVHAARG